MKLINLLLLMTPSLVFERRSLQFCPAGQPLMSNLLTKSFDNLNLKYGGDNGGPVQLPIPPNNFHGRRMYYGFETTEAWIVEYAKADIRKREQPPDPPYSPMLLFSESIRLLRIHSGMRYLRGESVFPEGTTIPPYPRSYQQSVQALEGRAVIIAIYSSSKWSNLPSQAQVNKLQQIMGGGEAKWWVSDI